MNKLFKYFKKPYLILNLFLCCSFSKFIPDKLYLKIKYRLLLGKKLNLNNPISFNEKLQWLKLHDRKDIYTKMVDKYDAKIYVSNLIGNDYIIPTIGVFDKFEDIDFEHLPNKFVVKCTHDSGGLVIVRDKKLLDKEKAKKKINNSLKRNYYYTGREWPYKNIKPRIIIEELLSDNESNFIRDYKFFCFNGVPKIMYISEGLENHETASMSFFDMDYNLLNLKREDYKLLDKIPNKPHNFELMKEFASVLSKGIPHVRVDFYEVDNKLYFGELTFFTCSGFIRFSPDDWDLILGNEIKLLDL